ncbi:MAG: acyltransferase [Acidobacteria bacterium]|nr:acyltransferase [Acidobacteriota bacterium]
MLRGLSILAVVLMHINIRIPFGKSALGSRLAPELKRAFFNNGYYGVKVFFVISGFLITTNLLRRWGAPSQVDVKAFYKLRFARIAPCLVALLVILSVLHGVRAEGYVIDSQKATLAEALFAAATFHLNVLEIRVGYLPASWDVLWSLSIEEVFYLGYPLLCRLLPDRRLLGLVAAGLIIAGPLARTTWAGGNEFAEDKAYLTGFDCIAMGCVAAWIVQRHTLSSGIRRVLWWVGVVMMVQIAVYPIVRVQFWRYGVDVTMLAIGTALCLMAIETSGTRTRMSNPLAWIGRNSYEIYLTHGFVMIAGMQAFVAWGSNVNAAPVWHVAMVCVSVMLGWVIARYYSEPLNRWLRGVG